MKVHVVDGTYELFRAFYAPGPSRTAADGMDMKATYGLLSSLLALLREDDVTHLAVAFDTVIESFRNELYDGYKTSDGIDPDLHAQFPLVEEATEALGIVTWRMVDFETDDALATAAARYSALPQVDQVVICSVDKDFAQCIRGDKVVMRDRRRKLLYNEAGVVEKWGVAPRSIPDWLALVGDSADGIPGISRWGAKSAAKVLAHYQHIEAIPDDSADWAIKVRGQAALAEHLAAEREEAMLYKTLATLREDVPLREEVDALRWTGPHEAAFDALCARLGIESLRNRVPEPKPVV